MSNSSEPVNKDTAVKDNSLKENVKDSEAKGSPGKDNAPAEGKKFPILLAIIPLLLIIIGVAVWFSMRNTASSMRLARLEGIVQLQDEQGREKSLVENMRFQSGNALRTEEASLVGINLDDTKLATLDAISRAQFLKKLKKIQLKLTQGRVFFEVTKDLAADETFDIETSTMVVGIRGTSGYVEVDEQGQESLVVTDGHVHVVGTNPVTGEVKEEDVYAGQGVTVYLFNDRKVDSIEFHLEEIHEKDLPLLALRLMVESDEHWTEDGKHLPPDGSIPDANDRPFDEGLPGLDVPEGHMLAGGEGQPANAAGVQGNASGVPGGMEGTGLAPSGTPADDVPKDGSLMDKVCVGANWSQELIHYYYEKVSNGEPVDNGEEETSEEMTSEEETEESVSATETEEETEETSEEETSESESETQAPSQTAATQAPTQPQTQAPTQPQTQAPETAATEAETAPTEAATEAVQEPSDDVPAEETAATDPENIDYDLTDEDDPNNLPDDPNNLPEEEETAATAPENTATSAPADVSDPAVAPASTAPTTTSDVDAMIGVTDEIPT